jgi:ribosomal protein S18 acetylase RimI-like enzyme
VLKAFLAWMFHLGVFIDSKLIGVCSFFKYNHQLLTEEFQYQLRGMAVLNTYQNKGLGNILLNYGETLLKEKNTNIIWCNAREKALNFYKKMGYEIIGEPFNIKDIGLHYVLWKKL